MMAAVGHPCSLRRRIQSLAWFGHCGHQVASTRSNDSESIPKTLLLIAGPTTDHLSLVSSFRLCVKYLGRYREKIRTFSVSSRISFVPKCEVVQKLGNQGMVPLADSVLD